MDQKRAWTGRRDRRWVLALAVPLVAAFAVGCGGDDERAAGPSSTATPSGGPERAADRKMVEVADAYVGRVADTEAFIAVTFDGGIVRAYVCDGEGTEGAVDQWFQGSWDGTSEVTLTGGPLRLTLGRDGGDIAGYLETADGGRLPFRAALPTTDGDGLFASQELDAASGEVRAQGHTIVLGSAERGAFAPVVTRCRRVRKTVVLADGTTASIIVEICG